MQRAGSYPPSGGVLRITDTIADPSANKYTISEHQSNEVRYLGLHESLLNMRPDI